LVLQRNTAEAEEADDILHWLDVPERVTFKLCMTVYKCLHGMEPIYLSEMCRPTSSVADWLAVVIAFS